MSHATQKTSDAPSGASTGPRLKIDVAARTHRGHVRDANEDAYFVFRIGRYLERVATNIEDIELPALHEDMGYMMVVADGLGGHEAGEVASHGALARALQLVMQSPRWALKLDDPATRAREIEELTVRARSYLADVHATLRRQASQDARLQGMGTTFTGAYAVGADMFVLHIGDSRAYLLRDRKLRRLTRDHTVAQEYADLGMIPEAEVETHQLRHVLTRAIGGPEEELQGDFHQHRLAPGDRLLLCSDGLSSMADEGTIAGVLADQQTVEQACEALIELALARGGSDNITVIVAEFQSTA